jgi:hypothetical protein
LAVGHPRWVNQQAVEQVQAGRTALCAVDGRLGTRGEGGLEEVLHVCGVVEGEGRVGLQGNEDVVGVDAGGAGLRESGRSGWGWGWGGNWGRGVYNWGRGWRYGLAGGGLSRALVSTLNLAADAASRVAAASIAGLPANDESVPALRLANSLSIG